MSALSRFFRSETTRTVAAAIFTIICFIVAYFATP